MSDSILHIPKEVVAAFVDSVTALKSLANSLEVELSERNDKNGSIRDSVTDILNRKIELTVSQSDLISGWLSRHFPNRVEDR